LTSWWVVSLGFEPRKTSSRGFRDREVFYVAASLGFEPRQRDPESLVLPLHHEATSEKIKDRCASLQVERSRVQNELLRSGNLFCFEQHFAAFLGRCNFQGPSTFCHEFASRFFHRLNCPVIMIWIMMEKQKCLHFGIERE
jgi:hypothetical protein